MIQVQVVALLKWKFYLLMLKKTNLTTVPHTVTFKVIGCTREQGHDAPILLTPEPTNPVHSRAKVFTCTVNGVVSNVWKGYLDAWQHSQIQDHNPYY